MGEVSKQHVMSNVIKVMRKKTDSRLHVPGGRLSLSELWEGPQ